MTLTLLSSGPFCHVNTSDTSSPAALTVPTNALLIVGVQVAFTGSNTSATFLPQDFGGNKWALAESVSSGDARRYTKWYYLKARMSISDTLSWPITDPNAVVTDAAPYYFVFSGGNVNTDYSAWPAGETTGNIAAVTGSSASQTITVPSQTASVPNSRFLSHVVTFGSVSVTSQLYAWTRTGGGICGAMAMTSTLALGASYSLSATRIGGNTLPWYGSTIEILPDDGKPPLVGWGSGW